MKNRSTCILLCCILLTLIVSNHISYANTTEGFFNEILMDTKSELIEYGFKISLIEEKNDEMILSEILNKLECQNTVLKDIKAEKSHYIEFKNEEVQGYLEYIYQNAQGSVNLEIIKIGHNLQMKEFENKLKIILESNDSCQVKSLYRYIKAKTNIQDTDKVVDQVIKKLRFNKAENIDKIELGNAVSITALTGRYEKIKNGEAWIDFNSAVCRYESGNYLIIGTPIIIKEY